LDNSARSRIAPSPKTIADPDRLFPRTKFCDARSAVKGIVADAATPNPSKGGNAQLSGNPRGKEAGLIRKCLVRTLIPSRASIVVLKM